MEESWERVLTGVKFAVDRGRVPTRDGGLVTREVVVHPGAVVVLPRLDDGRVVLIRNRRLAIGRRLWELPAGTLEPGEAPEDCARRELAEETGYRARSFEPLLSFFSAPGFCTERLHAFLAEGLEAGEPATEPTEEIEVVPVDPDRLRDLLTSGDIEDAKTLATLFYAEWLDRGRPAWARR